MVAGSQREWRQRPTADSARLGGNVHPVLRRVYAARGVTDAEQLQLRLAGLLPPELKGIDDAAAVIADGIAEQRRFCIVGDYDADGATATSLCMLALRAFGAQHVDFVVPDRFKLGYGLSPALIDALPTPSPDILITVDNGIASVAGVEKANAAGMQVVVTDHHLAGEQLPAAAAIVNPNQPGCSFASKALCGVGVAFYTLSAVRRALAARGWFGDAPPAMAQWLDLVALGTVADVVTLDYNNRILVEQGLRRIRASQARPGLLALLSVAGRDVAEASSTDLAFTAGPRLNAAGRMDDMRRGIACLLEDDPFKAREYALELDALNRARRKVQTRMQDEAFEQLDAVTAPAEDAAVHVLFDERWHEGVVGLVASKVKEQAHRPAFAFALAEDGQQLKGSGRSIPGFHLRDALATVAAKHPGLIPKFGGHAMAAGLSLARHDLPQFSSAMAEIGTDWLTPAMLTQCVETDGVLSDEELSLDTAHALQLAGPWGQGFPAPLFEGVFAVHEQKIVGERHVKLTLESAGGARIGAIAFNREPLDAAHARVAYRLEPNSFRGYVNAQALVEYWEPA